jgi:hypothetical protein
VRPTTSESVLQQNWIDPVCENCVIQHNLSDCVKRPLWRCYVEECRKSTTKMLLHFWSQKLEFEKWFWLGQICFYLRLTIPSPPNTYLMKSTVPRIANFLQEISFESCGRKDKGPFSREHYFCVAPRCTTPCNAVRIDANFGCMVLYGTAQHFNQDM